MKIRVKAVALCSLLLCSAAFGQDLPWPVPEAADPPPQPASIPLLGQDKRPEGAGENWARSAERGYSVRNVTRSTLTPILPDPAKATGTAVIVAPGGAMMALALDHEGYRVARALADRGIAAFVLKYRLLPTPKEEREANVYVWNMMSAGRSGSTRPPALTNPQATEDGLAALKTVRENAAKWGVDPATVGMIGFSAGAVTSLNTVLASKPGERPAFLGYIYGPQARVEVPADAPPMFNATALDDALLPPVGFPLAFAWAEAKRPVEIHGYQTGGHGFGLGAPGTTHALWMDEFITWLSMQGLLKHKVGT